MGLVRSPVSWSDLRNFGIPKGLTMVVSMALMRVSADLFGSGHTWMYPVNMSTHRRAALFPFLVIGMLGIKSMAHVTLGA